MSESPQHGEVDGAPTPPTATARPWDALSAIAWALLLLVGMLFAAPLLAGLLLTGPASTPGETVPLGLQVSVGLWLQLPVVALGVALPALLRRDPALESLGLRWPGIGALALTALATVGVAVVLYGASELAGRPVPAWAATIFRDPGPWPLLLSGLVLAVPLAEELLFRGYLFGRLEHGIGPGPAVLACALLFTAFHLQYEAFELAAIFVLAVVLGICRWKSGSLLAPLLMHGLYNLGSTWVIARELGVVLP